MRLFEIMSSENDIEHIVETIQTHCAPYIQVLKQTNGRGLFRGSNSGKAAPGHISMITPRANRTPKDTPKDIHEFLNSQFQQKFNYPYRNGLFTTGIQGNATFYGTVGAVFPIGELKYIWSPKVDDLFYVLERIREQFYEEDTLSNNQEFKQKVLDVVDSYQSTDLAAAIQSEHEVIFQSNCYMVNLNDYQQVTRELI